MLVLGGIHIGAHSVGSAPELRLESKICTVIFTSGHSEYSLDKLH